MVKRKTDWTPTMEGRAGPRKSASEMSDRLGEGHLWMTDYHDRLPKVVRQRLAASSFNICPACMDIEAREEAHGKQPSVAAYFSP